MQYDITKIWLITDTHLYHDKIKEYCDRPDDYNERIIENWKRMVAPGDTVIHLGDVIFKRKNELNKILESLPGIKMLTMGNHDKRTGTNTWFLKMGFNYVCKSHSYKNVLFSHKPLDLSQYPGIEYNIHGHLHRDICSLDKYPFHDASRHIRLSIEETDYCPVLLNELVTLR